MKNSNERRAYESVDDRSQLYDTFKKLTQNIIRI